MTDPPDARSWLVALAEAVRGGAVTAADALRQAARPERIPDVVAGVAGTVGALAALPVRPGDPEPLPELALAAGCACAAEHPAEAARLLEAGLRTAGPRADPDALLRGRVELVAARGRAGGWADLLAETDALVSRLEAHADAPLRGRCHLYHGRALRAAGRPAEAVAAFERASATFTGPAPDDWRAGVSRYELALVHRDEWEIEPALAALDDAVRLLEQAGQPRDLAAVLYTRAHTICRRDWFDTPLPAAEPGRPLDLSRERWAREGGPFARRTRTAEILADLARAADLVRPLPAGRPLLVQVLSGRALFLAGRGRVDEAVAGMTAAIEAADTPAEAAGLRACQGEWLEMTGRYAEAVAHYAEADRLYRLAGDADGRRSVLEPLTLAAETGGLFEAAWDAYHQLQHLESTVAPPTETDADVSAAVAAIGRAATAPPADAVALLDDAVPVLAAAGLAVPAGMAWHARATARVALGDRAGAADDLAAAVAAFDRGGAWFLRVTARIDRVTVLRYLGRLEDGAGELETLRAELDDEGALLIARMAARRAAGDRPEEVPPDTDDNPFATYQAEVEAWVARVFDGPPTDDGAYVPLVMGYVGLLHARNAGDRVRTVGALFALFDMLTEVGQPLAALRAADELADLIPDDEPTWIRAAWRLHRGVAEVRAGRFAQGQVTLEWALPNLITDDSPLAAHARALLGEAYRNLGQFGPAWGCLDAAIRRLDAMEEELAAHVARLPPRPAWEPPTEPDPARTLRTVTAFGTSARLNAGLLCFQAGDHDAAEHVFLDALGRVAEDDHAARALVEMNLGIVERARGHLPAAAGRLAAALDAFERVGGGANTNACRQNLAQVSRQLGDLPAALDLYARIDTAAYTHGMRLSYHLGYGLVLADAARPAEAVAHLRRAGAAHRAAVQEAGGGELALEYLGQKNDLAAAAAFLALASGDTAAALELAQAAKGLLAQEFLTDRPLPRADSPAVLAARGRVVAGLDRAGPRDGPDPLPEYLALTRAATVRPAPETPLAAEPGRTIDAVRAALPPGWVLLDFLRVDEDDLRVFVVTRDRVEPVRLDLARGGEPFRDRLRLLAEQLGDVSRRPEGWTRDTERVWDDLYEHLFRPLEPHLTGCRGLYLVPHGEWHAVPLHAARTRDRATAKHVYLQDRFPVAYLPAAAALPHLPPPVARPERCLSLANPERGTPRTLPFADWEATELAARFPGGRFFAGPAATADRADGWADVDLVHFGCHGTGEPAFAGLSRLYLAGGDCLLAHDVLYRRDPHKPGAVVLLNGCQTGVKDGRAVDESMGLMTSFLLRGAGVVMATQWHIGDDFAARAVTGFADRLAAGAPPSEALRDGLRTARSVRAERVAADAAALVARFPADQFPHEAAQLARLRPSAGGHSDNPLAWAAFQLFGRVT